jgi:hypothetical protein
LSADLRAIAREQNARDGLGPIDDPSVLRQVAAKLAAWREPDRVLVTSGGG